MKKFAMSAIAVAAVLGAGAANAYTSGTFSNGFVVPNVVKTASGATTTVGIINQSGGTVPVYWTFFDQESNHVADGCFYMTDKDYEPFVWSARAGTGMDDRRGYLVFAAGNTVAAAAAQCPTTQVGAGNGLIAGNSFYVDPVSQDVAFTPVIDGPLTISGNVSLMGPTSLTRVVGAAQQPANATAATAPQFSMRYFIDNAPGGNDTAIVVWSTGDQRGTHTTFMYDDKQNRRSVNFKLDHAELDWFNPESIPGRPMEFVDGFIDWQLISKPGDFPATATGDLYTTGGSIFTYSVISAPAFGAVQTVLGAHK